MSEQKTSVEPEWKEHFDERQQRLIANCVTYAKNDPAGLPAHNVMVIVAMMADLLDRYAAEATGE